MPQIVLSVWPSTEMVMPFYHERRRPLECPFEGTRWTKNPFSLFPNGLGMVCDLILVSHRKIIFDLCFLRMRLSSGMKDSWPIPRRF